MIIKSFGLEVRKIGNLDDLYKEVDVVLAKNIDMTAMTLAHGLKKMLEPNHFLDVCFIRKAIEMCGIVIPKERMNIYECVHCVSWNEMLPDYRNTIMAMLLDDFRGVLQNAK